MNSIVLELQQETLNSDISIVQLLRKALLISRKLNLKEFEKWINSELNGYGPNEDIPIYREVSGNVQAFNPYNGIWMPIFFESTQQAKSLSSRRISQKITELEKLAVKDNIPHLHVQFSKETEANLIHNLNIPSRPVLIVPQTSVIGIIESVRNIILDWTMKLEEESILGNGINFSEEEKSNAFSNSQINITNFQGVIGNIVNSSLNQTNKIIVKENDFNTLKDFLIKELEFSKEDVDNLEQAIEQDTKPIQKAKFGQKVSQWIGNMISKAASGAINLSISTAANVLGDAISKYYGL